MTRSGALDRACRNACGSSSGNRSLVVLRVGSLVVLRVVWPVQSTAVAGRAAGTATAGTAVPSATAPRTAQASDATGTRLRRRAVAVVPALEQGGLKVMSTTVPHSRGVTNQGSPPIAP